MRIAAVVHNSVRKDARVIKEAVSLARAGHTVTVHGISDDDRDETFRLPDSQVTVMLMARRMPEYGPKAPRGPSPLVNPWIRRPLYLAILTAVLAGMLVLANPVLAGLSQVAGGTVQPLRLLAMQVALSATAGLLALIFRFQIAFAVRSARRLLQVRWLPAKLIRLAERPVIRLLPSYGFAQKLAARRQRRNFLPVLTPLMASLSAIPTPDAVHLHDAIALMLAADIRKKMGCSIVWDAHEIYQDMSGANALRGLMNAAVIRAQAPFIDKFITINDSIAEFYRKTYQRLPPATVVMNATERTVPPRYDGRLHKAAGLPARQKILLFQGGFGAERGLRMLVEASQRLTADWTLVLMGWGKLEAELRALAATLHRNGPAPCTVFLPGVPHRELQDWSAGASLGAITYENTSLNHLYCTPNKLWEYPSAGVPILATDLEELGRTVRAHGIGYLLPRAFTAADIANAVNAATDEALSKMRAACRLYMEDNNWAAYEPRLLKIYEVLGAGEADDTARPRAARLQSAA